MPFKRASELKIVEITPHGAELRYEAIAQSAGHFNIVAWGQNGAGEPTQQEHARCGSREKAVSEMDDLFRTLERA
ncbi:hypothetical protein HOU00_gp253 [Caulobacter phage CcrPW]|uniref:WGR domain-containing protein n=1 Tax=Caulobacter phage CcrPW TaxID=2283271 RepID=A0A385EDE2_9CAUD|nr:hypothetical protein HOU00_gp253 [Caulobacter phage CcrPW]AXQ68872.1 hypothetical protein CcrPW_gp333 [Caulobacter phage CcrPW]